MRTVKLVIAFRGTRYEGWQSQRGSANSPPRTIQELFEKILHKLFKQHTPIVGSSRTDSGVHARGFVAHFRTKSPLSDATILKALNFHLPEDVVVISARTVAPEFHARFHARSKVYRYEIWSHPIRPVFEAPFVLWHPGRLDLAAMRRAARRLMGRHDFSAFRDRGDERENAVRTVKRIVLRKKGPVIQIDIEADGFLRHMIRVIVGTLMEAGKGRRKPEEMTAVLGSKDRKSAGPTAKPHGLTLWKVRY
ncbi:MAG: tRNA pseudouridine(38-40) synthase TruA [Omnitrophica bacterium RIFCSPHIGHO2_02_FULL_63_14]|nr:MAG: tRNA pseudouridine(38-40) synthase TruA [Omnitrophica bacterium RIFCSPHIGHO2_02_FULL_63_14]